MHLTYAGIANRISQSNWGREYATEQEAEKAILSDPSKLAAYGIVELLRRLNSLGDSGKVDNKVKPLVVDEDTARYPDTQVGDRLYSSELSEGLAEYLVVGRSEDGVCLIVLCDYCLEYPDQESVAWKGLSTTMSDALRKAAEEDIEYHGKAFRYAETVLQAVESGDDLTQFTKARD